jgi:putative NIF3 family GTP cyclohydrolase 1 type 2
MKIEKVLQLIEQHAPSVEYEPSIFFGSERESITGIGVCVDPTKDVIRRAKRRGIDMLVSHHYPSERSSKYASERGVYAIVTHLRQDVAPQGNIETFAYLIGLENPEPFTIRYKKMVVPNGVVTGDFGGHYGHRSMRSVKEILLSVLTRYGLKPKIKIFLTRKDERVSRAAVTTGAAIKPEFLEQVAERNIDTYIAAEMEQPAVIAAEELGINLIDVGHYETEVPGMTRLAKKLGAEFIPNRYKFSSGETVQTPKSRPRIRPSQTSTIWDRDLA